MRVLIAAALAVTVSGCVHTGNTVAPWNVPATPFETGTGNVVDILPSRNVRLGYLYTQRGGTGSGFTTLGGDRFEEICPADFANSAIKAALVTQRDVGEVSANRKRRVKGTGSFGANLPYVTQVGAGVVADHEVTVEHKNIKATAIPTSAVGEIAQGVGSECVKIVGKRQVYVVQAVHTGAVEYKVTANVELKLGEPSGFKLELFGGEVTIGVPQNGVSGKYELEDSGIINGMTTGVELVPVILR